MISPIKLSRRFNWCEVKIYIVAAVKDYSLSSRHSWNTGGDVMIFTRRVLPSNGKIQSFLQLANFNCYEMLWVCLVNDSNKNMGVGSETCVQGLWMISQVWNKILKNYMKTGGTTVVGFDGPTLLEQLMGLGASSEPCCCLHIHCYTGSICFGLLVYCTAANGLRRDNG
jgi:hypothetical protein